MNRSIARSVAGSGAAQTRKTDWAGGVTTAVTGGRSGVGALGADALPWIAEAAGVAVAGSGVAVTTTTMMIGVAVATGVGMDRISWEAPQPASSSVARRTRVRSISDRIARFPWFVAQVVSAGRSAVVAPPRW